MTHVQGPVPLGDESYVERDFEQQVVQQLLAGRWVLLLGPRQHGKTSALVRVRGRLIDAGLPTSLVDLQRAPPLATYDELVGWFCDGVRRDLGVAHQALLPGNDLIAGLSHALPAGRAPVVVLIDEASNIPDPQWRNSFFGQLRAISGQRATARTEEAPARLRFAFSGTFRPETLIDDANSPFNVCERIDTADLSEADVVGLCARELGDGHEHLAALIAYFSSYSPQLNPVERLWLYLRETSLSLCVFRDRQAIIDACCDAWNRATKDPRRIQSLCNYPYIKAVSS